MTGNVQIDWFNPNWDKLPENLLASLMGIVIVFAVLTVLIVAVSIVSYVYNKASNPKPKKNKQKALEEEEITAVIFSAIYQILEQEEAEKRAMQVLDENTAEEYEEELVPPFVIKSITKK